MALFLPGPGPRNFQRGISPGAVEAIVPLETAASVSTATLALTAPTTIVFGSARSYSVPILAATPSLYWRLGASGTTDQSGNGRNGTGQGGVTIGGATGALVGDTEAATDFDGSDDYISSSYSPFVNGTVRTFEGWAYGDVLGKYLVAGSLGGSDRPELLVPQTDGAIYSAVVYSGTFLIWSAGTWPTTPQWIHWVVIVDEPGNTIEMFINGVSQGAKATTDSYGATPGNLQISGRATSSDVWDGRIDEVAVYERALTPAEILEHYNAGVFPSRAHGQSSASLTLTTPARLIFGRPYATVIKATGPGMYWILDAATGGTDQSGNGRDGSGAAGGVTIGGYTGSPVQGYTTSTDFDDSVSPPFITSSYQPYTNSTARTYEGWAYRDTSSTNDVLVAGHTYPCPFFYLPSATQNVLWAADGAHFVTWTAAWPGNSQWVHWVLVFNESTDAVELFINGVSQGAQTDAFAYPASIDYRLGAYGGGGDSWDGKMGQIAVYERALTPLEVWEHYNAGLLPPCSAQSSGTLTIFTPQVVPLATAAAVSTATLVLTAQTTIPLATSAAVSTATLALSAKTTITLATSAAVSTGTLALTAPTYITLATSAAVSTATLTLTAPAKLTLATAAAVSTATLTLTAPAILVLSTAAAVSTATLALTAKTTITLATSAAVSTATLALTAATKVVLATSAAVSTATLTLTAPGLLTLQTATVTSAGTLTLTAQTYIVLSNAVAISTATLAVTIPGSSVVPLSIAAATSSATLTLVAQTYITLVTAAGLSTATLDVTAPSVGGGGVGLEMPVLLLMLDDDD